jgi:hypothetical protein
VRHWITNGEAEIGDDQVSGSNAGVSNIMYSAKKMFTHAAYRAPFVVPEKV